jgi:hypothetical protein
MGPSRRADIREEVRDKLFWRGEGVWLHVAAIMTMISFARPGVVGNQALPDPTRTGCI